jgi:hypothetical protein
MRCYHFAGWAVAVVAIVGAPALSSSSGRCAAADYDYYATPPTPAKPDKGPALPEPPPLNLQNPIQNHIPPATLGHVYGCDQGAGHVHCDQPGHSGHEYWSQPGTTGHVYCDQPGHTDHVYDDGHAGCSGAADCGCDSCCCGPRWTIRAGAVILKRERPDSYAIFSDAGTGATVLDAGNYNFGFRGGLDISAIRHFGSCNALEVRYFGIDGWTANQAGAFPAAARLNTATPIFFNGFNNFVSSYGSELFSTEVNWRRQTFPNLAFLAGFRYLELNEDIRTQVTGAPGTALYNIDTDNRLFGFQIGADGRLWCRNRFSLDGLAKAGIYGNTARHRGIIEFPPGNPVFGPVNQRGTHTAFVGEIGLTGVYQLTNHLAVRGGYQLLWVDGVALASEQVAATNFTTNTGINTNGDAFYHGALVSLEASW